MPKPASKSSNFVVTLSADYSPLLAEIKWRVQTARIKVGLAADMQRAFPWLRGFSPLNVWRMRAFYLAYTDGNEILSQAVTESSAAAGSARSKRAIVQQAGAQLRKQASGIVQAPLAQTTQSVAAIVQPSVAQMGSPKYQISNPESCLNGNRIVVITA